MRETQTLRVRTLEVQVGTPGCSLAALASGSVNFDSSDVVPAAGGDEPPFTISRYM